MTTPLDPTSPEGKTALDELADVLADVDARLAREAAEQRIRETA